MVSQIAKSIRVFPKSQMVVVDGMPTANRETDRVLRRVNNVLSGPHRLDLSAIWRELQDHDCLLVLANEVRPLDLDYPAK